METFTETKVICEKVKKAVSSYIDYVQAKIDATSMTASSAGNTEDDDALWECIRTLNHVAGILMKLKEVESENASPITVHNSYVTNY